MLGQNSQRVWLFIKDNVKSSQVKSSLINTAKHKVLFYPVFTPSSSSSSVLFQVSRPIVAIKLHRQTQISKKNTAKHKEHK